jgi:heme/copper-type cytochrome/quinol oxidase subunit 1
MHLTGLLGMPRRVFTYGAEAGWTSLNLLSSVAAVVFAAGLVLFVIDCVRSAFRGPPAGRNP